MGLMLTYLEALRARNISFRYLQHKLKDYEIESALGWPKLLEKHKRDPIDKDILNEWEAGLKELLENNILYGNRAIAIYEVEERDASLLATRSAELLDSTSPFLTSFPLPIPITELPSAPHTPVPTKSRSVNKIGKRIMFCVKRFVKSREDVDIEDFDDNVKGALAGYDEIIGVRRGYVQGYDSVLFLPSEKRVEIHIDLSCALTGDDISRAFDHYKIRINQWASRILSKADPLPPPKNFFPLISKLYAAQDGCVVSLGHSTSTSSLKEEKMRRKNLDLRTEPFHLGGLAGVHNITDPYSITKTWPGGIKSSTPGATIPGHFSSVGSTASKVGYAIVSGCTNKSDFDLVMSKLL